MSQKKDQPIDPYMNDCYSFIHDMLGTEYWIPLYINQTISGTKDEFFLYSALIPQGLIDAIISKYEWEINIDSFHPGMVTYYDHGQSKADYLRFGREDEIEPILIQRHFWGIKKSFFEVSEEFRHLYNLYYDEHENRYIAILDDGSENVVIKISDCMIEINAKYLKEFLSLKKVSLCLYVNIDRYSQGKFSEFGQEYIHEIRAHDTTICSISISDYDWQKDEDILYSRLLGKKVIIGISDFDPLNFSPNEVERNKFLEFIIDVDSNNSEIFYTCDKEKLANFFGKNPGSPNYVTPVFFNREVLTKYYANPGKYSIHDGYLYCEGLWSLRIDNNHDKFVIVMLGDLGSLSFSEQQYWKSYNVIPDGGFSDVAFKRGVEGEFTDPSMKDLVFKQKYTLFQEKWKKLIGWDILLPLNDKDYHYFKKIRVPLSENQSEFDDLVLAITKVIIDSLNEGKISEYLSSKIENERGISKFNRLFKENNLEGFEEHIKFLRDLQELKSTSASHIKGKKYHKIEDKWGIGKRRYKEIIIEILDKSIQLLDFLDDTLLSSDSNIFQREMVIPES